MDATKTTLTETERERLANMRDACQAALDGKPWQWWNGQDWCDGSQLVLNPTPCRFQKVRPAPPKPEPVPWDCVADVPVICWIRVKGGNPNEQSMVIGVGETGVDYIDDVLRAERETWHDLAEYCEYSTDRKTWLPCTKPEARP